MPAGKETKGARTLATYEASAQVYIDRTERSRPELETFMKKFASAVGSGRILEIGSGPGWDAIYLEGLGLQVERTDATAAFVEILRADGVDARQLDAVTDDLGGPYDGIFANAVFLHLTREELSALLVRARASSGVLAFTLKEGDGEQWSTAKLYLPRHFTFWREQPLRDAVESAGWNVASLERVGEPGTQQWLFVVAT